MLQSPSQLACNQVIRLELLFSFLLKKIKIKNGVQEVRTVQAFFQRKKQNKKKCVVVLPQCDSVRNWKTILVVAHRKQIRSPVQTFSCSYNGALCLKQNNRFWLGFCYNCSSFLTLSFKAICAISSICNGRVDVSVVNCTAIARFVRLLMQSPRLNAGRGGKGATADSVLTCLAMPAV